MNAPEGLLDMLARIAKANAEFAACPEARPQPSMLGRQAGDLITAVANTAELIVELDRAHDIILRALTCLTGAFRVEFLRTLKEDGLDVEGFARYHERKALLIRVGGTPA